MLGSRDLELRAGRQRWGKLWASQRVGNLQGRAERSTERPCKVWNKHGSALFRCNLKPLVGASCGHSTLRLAHKTHKHL